MKKVYPGILLVISISLISEILHESILDFVGTLTIGILLGIIYSNTLGLKNCCITGVNFSLKRILKWGIVLLGVKLNFSMLFDLGPWIAIIVVLMVSSALFLSNLIGKWFNINPKLSTLLGVGSSICGASAVVAMGPVIDAEEDDIAVSVAVISILGTIGVLIYTFLSYVVPLSDLQYGIWSGSTLQGVAHALAAAGARGSENISLEIGTIVKMSRVALLAPVALILSFIFKDKSSKSSSKGVKFPLYVLFFILTGIIFTLNSIYNFIPASFSVLNMNIDIISFIKELSSFFILMAMVAMGLKVNFKSFKSKGLKALFACSIVFLVLSLIGYLIVQFIN